MATSEYVAIRHVRNMKEIPCILLHGSVTRSQNRPSSEILQTYQEGF